MEKITLNNADEARYFAIEYQKMASEVSLSYAEIAEWQTVFEGLANKWPELREEFEENGII